MRAGMRFAREREVSTSAKTHVSGIDLKPNVAHFDEGLQGSKYESI